MLEKDAKASIPLFYRNLMKFVRNNPQTEAIEAHLETLARSATLAAFDSFDADTRSTGHRAYDTIIEDIFTGVIRAISRETLLTQTLEALWSQKTSQSTQCFFVLETVQDTVPGATPDIKAITQKGLNEHLWSNFVAEIRPRLGESLFLQDVLLSGNSVPLWLSIYIPKYDGAFDLLVKARQRNVIPPQGYWISALALKSNQAGHPNRALIALYENRGDEVTPRLPSGANQEWRVLHFLGIAYQVLQHQLANVAEEVHSQRQKLLSILAPGILHHEIGNQIDNMRGLLAMLQTLAQRLNNQYHEEDTERLLTNLVVLQAETNKLSEIADAFNNMERRRPREKVYLETILQEIKRLTYHRLGKVGAWLQWEPAPMPYALETDPALLLHLILNIVINALNAFEEDDYKNGRVLALCTENPNRTDMLRMTVMNNGPEIPSILFERIFEKGFTTRRGGHGHGLYICRLIAVALGGAIRVVPRVELPTAWTVGLQIDLPLVAEREHDLIGERRTGKS